MIITCPSCATRYDVDDRRFSPEGRSVRCAECDESWFVPAPQPIEDLIPLKKQGRVYAEEGPRESPQPTRQRHAGNQTSAASAEESRRDADRNADRVWRDDAGYAAEDEIVDEPLFDSAPPRGDARAERPDDFSASTDGREERNLDDDRDQRLRPAPPPLERDEKGRFVKTKKQQAEFDARNKRAEHLRDRDDALRDDAPEERRFGKSRREEKDERASDRRADWRDDKRRDRDQRDQDRAELRADRNRQGPDVVDVDFEDISSTRADYYDEPIGKGFGRKVREERRRETALARLEDLEPVAERIFNEEFFTALRVQPKELERAIRKARRRAEAREKNRLTPLRAIGWSAWVGAIAACAFVAYSYRNNIVAMFPNAKTAYEAVGIEANPYGLKIEGVTHRVALSPEGPVIEILGRLRNEEAGDVAPPMLLAEALGSNGEVLSRWTFAANADRVRSGQSADFSTRAPAPDGVSEVILSFAPAEGVKVSVGDLLKTAN